MQLRYSIPDLRADSSFLSFSICFGNDTIEYSRSRIQLSPDRGATKWSRRSLDNSIRRFTLEQGVDIILSTPCPAASDKKLVFIYSKVAIPISILIDKLLNHCGILHRKTSCILQQNPTSSPTAISSLKRPWDILLRVGVHEGLRTEAFRG